MSGPPAMPPRRRWRRDDGFEIDTDPARLDRDRLHRALATESYWSDGITRARFERSLACSLPFGVYAPDGAQAGFARVVTDQAVFAWLGDVFVLVPFRGRGLGIWLVGTILASPELQDLRRWELSTRDAHGLYARFGFEAADPAIDMRRVDPGAHRR